MKTERAIEKIKKLLALSKSTNPNEAATALRQAQALMAKHNVSDVDISMASIGEGHLFSRVSVSRIKPWEWTLVNRIAGAFNCTAFYKKGDSHGKCKEEIYAKYTLIGLRSQVEIAVYTVEVILRKIMKAKAEFAKTLDFMLSRQGKTAEIDGFLHGWTKEIMKTVHEFVGDEEVNLAIEDYTAKYYPNLVDGRTQNRRIGAAGLNAGIEAARGESINRPVNGQAETKLIG